MMMDEEPPCNIFMKKMFVCPLCLTEVHIMEDGEMRYSFLEEE